MTPEEKREYNRQWRAAHPDYKKNYYRDPEKKALRAAQEKERRGKDIEGYRAYRREYRRNMTEEQKQRKREWSNEFRRKRYEERMELAVSLKGGCCRHCGLTDHYSVYDFHHLDPSTKKYKVSGIIGWMKWEIVLAELEKCCLLCSNCHRKVTCGVIALS